MNKVCLSLIFLLVFAIPVMAGDDQTTHTNWESQLECGDALNEYLDESGALDHNHSLDLTDRENPTGVGVDVIVYENEESAFEKVTIESKYDFNNNEGSVFAVCTFNLFKMFKK